MPEQGQRFTAEGVPIVDDSDRTALETARKNVMGALEGTADESGMEAEMDEHVPRKPKRLTLFDRTDGRYGEQERSRSEIIAIECVESGEPFFVLRAKDMFSVMAVNNYSKLVDEYGPLDTEFHVAVLDIAQEMREWQMAHQDRVKYPD